MNQPLHSAALDQALAASRTPGVFPRVRGIDLPEDMLLLIRIAAGEAEAREWACRASGKSDVKVSEAAKLFIQQVMFHPDSDSYRVLGVLPSADSAQIKEHHRWLVRWLHPDRNPDQWDAVYADRVNSAWQDLRTDARRSEYDAQRKIEASSVRRGAINTAAQRAPTPVKFTHADEFILSRRAARLMPMLIFGGLMTFAAAALGLQYYLGREQAGAAKTVEVARAVETPIKPSAFAANADANTNVIVDSPAPIPVAVPMPEQQSEIALLPEPPAPAEISIEKVATAPAVNKTPIVENAAPQIAVAPVQRTQPILAQVAPVAMPTRELTPTPVAPVALIDEASARQIILRFRDAYASGNIQQVRALLVRYSNGAGDDGQIILQSYSQLFNNSKSRRIELHDPSWLTDGDTAILLASYEAWVVPRGKSQGQQFKGDIRFDLRVEDGELRIARLRQNTGQG